MATYPIPPIVARTTVTARKVRRRACRLCRFCAARHSCRGRQRPKERGENRRIANNAHEAHNRITAAGRVRRGSTHGRGPGMALKRWCWLAALTVLGLPLSYGRADHVPAVSPPPPGSPPACVVTETPLKGKLMDYTHHHGADRRIWSRALYQK